MKINEIIDGSKTITKPRRNPKTIDGSKTITKPRRNPKTIDGSKTMTKEGAGISQWVRADLRPELGGGAFFHNKEYFDKALQATPGSWLHTAAMNSPQHPDRGFEWATPERRRKIRKATQAGVTGAQKYAQKYKDKTPFVPKVKGDIYKNVRYPE